MSAGPALDAASREVVVVTGASAGIGRATARAFGARGASVGLIARGRDGLEGARREIEAAGGQALVLPLDGADADRVEAAADRVEPAFGPSDVWVNNAMLTVFGPVHAVTAAEFRHVDRSDLPGHRARHHGGAQAHATARSRHHRAGRQGRAAAPTRLLGPKPIGATASA